MLVLAGPRVEAVQGGFLDIDPIEDLLAGRPGRALAPVEAFASSTSSTSVTAGTLGLMAGVRLRYCRSCELRTPTAACHGEIRNRKLKRIFAWSPLNGGKMLRGLELHDILQKRPDNRGQFSFVAARH